MLAKLAKLYPRSLRGQLIWLLFGMSAVLVIALGFVGIRELKGLGSRAETITAHSMEQRVQQLLVQTTNATADKNSAKFTGIQSGVTEAAAYMQDIFDRPADFNRSNWTYGDHVFRLPEGQYGNATTELSSIFIPSSSAITPQLKQRIELSGYLDYVAPHILASQPDAVAVYYMGPEGRENRYYPNIGLATITPPDFDIPAQSFFSVAAPSNDPTKETKWTSVYDDPAGHGLTVTAASPIYNHGSFSGVMGMDVTLTNIAKNIEDYSPIESSYAFLVDTNGRAVALPKQAYTDLLGRPPKPNEFGSDLGKVSGDFGHILQQMRSGKQGFSAVKSQNVGLYVAYAPVKGTPFSLGIVARQAAMLQVVTDLRHQVATTTSQALYQRFLPLGVGVLLLVWWAGLVYIRRINGPIRELTVKTAEVANGALQVKPIMAISHNEIGQLATSFNRMVTQLTASRKQIEKQNQELLHNEQARLKASINSLRVGFIMTDPQNNVIMLNGAARKMLSKNTERDWSTDEIDARLGEAAGFKAALQQALKAGKPVDRKEVIFGNMILRIFVSPILEKNHTDKMQRIGAVVLVEDITEAKSLEHSKDEFFSIASHELRTPLTAVRGNASMLQREYGEKLHDSGFDEMVGDIHDASVRLIEIVNDFLDATRLEQGKIKFVNQAFDVREVLKTVVYEMASVAKDKGISVSLDGALPALPAIVADKNRVKQIVYNLVGNAMKFTEKGGVTVAAKVEGAHVKVLVSDTGPGISDENQRLLFRKFQQAANSFMTRDARGTGLGLYISKLLSEQMGGKIALEHSKVGVGTTFSFTLPAAKDGQPAKEIK